MTRRRPAASAATVATAVVVALGASVANADLFGGDVAVLSAIFETTLKQLDEARRASEALGGAYSEARRLATYAGDARAAYRAFQRADGNRAVSSGVRALDQVFPEIGGGGAAAVDVLGALDPEVAACLASIARGELEVAARSPRCERLRQAAAVDRIRAALDRTFGTIPAAREDLAAVRGDSVAADRERLVDQARMALVSADASELLVRCKDAADPSVCGRIAAEAGVKAYEQQAETNRRLGELVHQHGVANELLIADELRDAREARARREALLGVDTAGVEP
jgi:hypothetical protein